VETGRDGIDPLVGLGPMGVSAAQVMLGFSCPMSDTERLRGDVSMYAILRVAHGYWRWAVLLSAIVVLVRAATRTGGLWNRADERAVRQFLGALDLQFTLGVVLYFGFSPFWLATYHSFRETLTSPVARFFGVEHETAMLLAFLTAHAGHAGAKRTADGDRKRRTIMITMLVFFALVLWAIPWPWRVVGRPLFRTSFE
jgi:hypothetical protein